MGAKIGFVSFIQLTQHPYGKASEASFVQAAGRQGRMAYIFGGGSYSCPPRMGAVQLVGGGHE